MPVLFLPYLIYSLTMDAMFRNWGFRKDRHTIIAVEDEPSQLALPPPRANVVGGI